MYRVVIVDDEMPALRFVRSIIEQISKDFQVVCVASSGEHGLEFLRHHPVDLLITDINMHGMTGIELAQHARKLLPNIHIVIVSGYGEFEYAQGAIQAGVDDYLLKPVSITKMTAILQSVKKKLDAENQSLAASILPLIACGRPYSKESTEYLYGQKRLRFAYIRWGTLDMTLPSALVATSLLAAGDEPFQILRGRDDHEQLLIAEESPLEEFLAGLSVYMTQPGNLSTWTAIYAPDAQGIEALPGFIDWALTLIRRKTVIGRHQIIKFMGGTATEERLRLPSADLKQLMYFLSSGKMKMVKDYFISLAVTWEREQMPQRQVWHMTRQLIHQVATERPPVYDRLDEVLMEYDELIKCASSYGDLMSSTYSILFDNGNIRDRRLSTQELYDYAVRYIEENYARPLSMTSVCEEVGISQTYLNRLFRKYSDTTYSAYLTRCRMEAAVRLIKEKPNLLLRDVAACVGYDDSSYFAKVFQQYTGKTPSQYAAEG
ncbi:MAG: response regulator [Oscillospiraceae bacterium]|jgi:two-component system response regulator YesN|nr:response regulator [Oscillospiraceae bacterium]